MSDAGATAPGDVATQEAPQAPVEAPSFQGTKHKIKVDGAEREVEYDELVRGYQKGSAANDRFQRAAEMQRTVEGLLQRAKQGDLSWLEGIVPEEQQRKWAEQRLLRHIEWEQMTPEQRELHAMRREKEQWDSERKRSAEDAQNRAAAAAQQQAYQEIDQEITEAVSALGKKPTPRLVRRIAEQIMASLDSGEDDEPRQRMPAKQAAERAYRDYVVDAESLLSEMSPEDVLGVLDRAGKRDAVRKAIVESATAKMPSGVRGQASKDEPQPTRRGQLKRMTTDEWFARLDKKIGGKPR